MSLHVNEGVYSEEDQARSMDQQVRDENRGSLATMGQQVINANNPISEEQEAQNNILLLSGDHGGFRLSKPGSRLVGVPGAIVKELGTVESNCIIENIHFACIQGSDTNLETLLHITSSAKVLVRNCTFERRHNDAEGRFVLIESGCKAVIEGCVFRSSSVGGAMAAGTGYVVEHLSAAATNVYVGLGFNLTGLAHHQTTAMVPELT